MFSLIKIITLGLMSILPDSPFRPYINQLGDFDFLAYLNWFVPFDKCVEITYLWVAAIFIYYNYDRIKDFIYKIVTSFLDN